MYSRYNTDTKEPSIKGYENRPEEGDYVSHVVNETENGRVDYGFCEIAGPSLRRVQEDAIAHATGPMLDWVHYALENMNDDEIRQILQQTIADLQKRYGQQDLIGSTCNLVITLRNPKTNEVIIWSVNLGNSAGFYFITKGNNLIKAEQLNKLHEPDQPDELERLRTVSYAANAEGEEILGRKINNVADYIEACAVSDNPHIIDKLRGKLPTESSETDGLQLSRGFGNTIFSPVGYSDQPEIKKYTIKLDEHEPGSEVYVGVGCDGIWEGYKGNNVADFIGEIVATNLPEDPADIGDTASKVVEAAVKNNSKDNMSFGLLKAGPQAGAFAVLDGNGVPKTMYREEGEARYTPKDFTQKLSGAFFTVLGANVQLTYQAKEAEKAKETQAKELKGKEKEVRKETAKKTYAGSASTVFAKTAPMPAFSKRKGSGSGTSIIKGAIDVIFGSRSKPRNK